MAWNGSVGAQASPYQQQQQQPQYNGSNSQYNQQSYGQPSQGQQYGQQPPYGPQHTQPYQQQPYNQGQYQQNRHSNQPYPPKRKGNPVITRYAPPPGYQGHQQQGAPYGHNQYQQQSPQGYNAPQSYNQQPPNYPPNQGYQQPQGSYPPQQGYQQPPNYQQTPNYGQPPQQQGNYQQPPHPPPTYPNQNYQPPQGFQGAQGYPPPQSGYHGAQGYPPQGYQGGAPDPKAPPQQYQSNQQWQNQGQQGPYPQNEQYGPYGPQAPQGQDSNGPPHSHPDQSSPTQSQQPSSAVSKGSENPTTKGELYLAWDDWDFDFDGALWPKGNDAIDPSLSIGIIVWHPAIQVTRALPSDYADAEKQALRPPAKRLDNGESISEFFRFDNSHEAFLDIRQTDHWDRIKDDTIFYVFPNKSETIPLEEVIANRDRPGWSISEGERRDAEVASQGDSNWNVMDNLEQALSAGGRGGPQRGQHGSGPSTPRNIQRTYSRDQSQEDALARLGVTGSPKPIEEGTDQNDVPPSSEKESPEAVQRTSRTSSLAQGPPQRVYGPSTGLRPPPPPEPERSPSYDPWKADQPLPANGQSTSNGGRNSPAGSEGSQHTLAGEDFGAEQKSESRKNEPDSKMEDSQPPQRPSFSHSDSSASRKRSYEESEANSDDKQRQQDDVTPRHKRRQPQVAAAYSRRW